MRRLKGANLLARLLSFVSGKAEPTSSSGALLKQMPVLFDRSQRKMIRDVSDTPDENASLHVKLSKVAGSKGNGEEESGGEAPTLGEEARQKLRRAEATARELKSIRKLTKQAAPSALGEKAPSLEEHIWRPLGIGLIAEAQIQESIRRGTLQNLKGKGKPLPKEDYGAQFFRTDPTLHALMRTLGAQGVRPESIDRRDALKRARDRLAMRVRQLAESGGVQLENLKAGHDDATTFLFSEVMEAIVAYNDALLKDKETYPGWPLIAFPKLDLRKEVERLLAEQEKPGSVS